MFVLVISASAKMAVMEDGPAAFTGRAVRVSEGFTAPRTISADDAGRGAASGVTRELARQTRVVVRPLESSPSARASHRG